MSRLSETNHQDQDGNKKNNKIVIFPEYLDAFVNAVDNIRNFVNKED